MISEFRGEYYFLSNFFNAPVKYDGISYLNNEAAFQAQKTKTREERYAFSSLDPSAAKRRGRHVDLRDGWDNIRITIMEDIVKAKFSQNEELAEKLLATDDEYLIEGNTWGDRFWGTVNGEGRNQLGIILMQVRNELRAERSQT